MNRWIEESIRYANSASYLDDLFQVYPTIPAGPRSIDRQAWNEVEEAFRSQDNLNLIRLLLAMDLFPIKDSYIAYFKRDKDAVERNPKTVNRICDRLYEMGLEKILERCSEPKETNRQIGPMFQRWLKEGGLGMSPVPLQEFEQGAGDAILDGSDRQSMLFAQKYLNYQRNKGLDFVGRFNGKYVIGEAKFLTDFGGHQNAQFNDAIATLETPGVNAIKVAILDGVLYVKGKNKMYKEITTIYNSHLIMSSLLLRDFLYQI